MKKKVIIGICSGVLILGTVFTVTACRSHRCHSRMAVRFAERAVERVEDELNLNETQKKQFAAIRVRIKADVITHLEERSSFMDQIDAKLNSKNPNVDEVTTLIRNNMRKNHAKMEQKLSYISEFYNILNAEQKQILLNKIREKMEEKQDCLEEVVDTLNKADI